MERSQRHAALEVAQVDLGGNGAVDELPGAGWWRGTGERMRRVVPSFYGIEALDPAW